jgi:formylmethanofuran dehydrogenase subunit A
MSELLQITGGRVIDPTHNVDEVRDLWILDGRVIAAPPRGPNKQALKPTRVIDAAGDVVMPGGIDMHSHIAGSKVNIGRGLLPEARRTGEHTPSTLLQPGGSLGVAPTSWMTGMKYAGLGYTTVFDAAIAPLLARLAHRDLRDTPQVDSGCYLLVGNDRYLLEKLAAKDKNAARDYLAWILTVGRGYAFKLVNPGGVEAWKQGRTHDESDLNLELPDLKLTPRQIIVELAELAQELNLPHPIHLHGNNLGLPGNWRTTQATIRALAGLPAHLTHIQYHSYAGGAGDETTFGSRVAELVAELDAQPQITVDVGQALFGPTLSMTGDSAAAQYLARITGGRRVNHDLEGVGGCGVFPIEYKNKSVVHAWQFVIGLEWFLLMRDPWRLALTTDHPNGATFWRYPYLVRLLMDSAFRREAIARLPRAVREQTILRGIDREYSLNEICILTRAAPARMLGLTDRGHLGVGARGDVTIYRPDTNYEVMFQAPRYTIKAGEVLVEHGEAVRTVRGEILRLERASDDGRLKAQAAWFTEHLSVPLEQFAFAGDTKVGS